MLKLRNITITINKNSILERTVLQNLTLDIAEGEFVVIIGANGTGKSTLLNTISGSVAAEAGSVILNNSNITNVPENKRAKLIAKVLQDPKVGTMETMSIEENLSFAFMRGKTRTLKPYSNEDRKRLFREKLTLLGMGLENRLDDLVSSLSGGQRQALSLIMATLSDAKILLLDEITAALDPKTAELIMQLTQKIVTQQKRSTILITHNMSHALRYGNRTLLLNEGKIVKEFSMLQKSHLTPAELAAIFDEI